MISSQYVSFFLLSAFLLFSCCDSKNKKTYAVICFDVEDFINPGEYIDDNAKWLAQTLTEENMTGTFFVSGEKARAIERSGRADVISALAKHEIGSHTNFGSMHPTITEFLENMEWQSGVDSMKQREIIGIKDIEKIFGKKIATLSRHGGSYGPQLISASGEMGFGYVYSLIKLENHNIVWFCNTLNFDGFVGGFSDIYFKDELFNPYFEKFKETFEQLVQGQDFIIFYFGDVAKIVSEQYSDFLNYSYGINTPLKEWKIPEARPGESIKVAQANFRRLIQFCKNQKNVKFTTFADLMKRFSYQKDLITINELVTLSNRIVDENRPITDKYFSPAEIFSALAAEISEYAENKKFLKKVKRTELLGPTEMPLAEPEILTVTNRQIESLAHNAVIYCNQNRMVPSNIEVEGKKIGAGSLLHLFSRYFLDCTNNMPKNNYSVSRFDPYPREYDENLIKDIESCKLWTIHKPNLDMSKIVYYTKLQFWTLKPAMEKQ